VEEPRVLTRRIVELSDPGVPESKQPYHAAMGVLEDDPDSIQTHTEVVRGVAKRSVADLLGGFRAAGHRVQGAGLVVDSRIDPESISNPHIRAHALEGRLFRTVLEDALAAHGLSGLVVVEREAYVRASAPLGREEAELMGAVAALGRSLPGPWRADEKLAALVAWMALD